MKNNKINYEILEIDVVLLSDNDIITASSSPYEPNGNYNEVYGFWEEVLEDV